MALIQTQSYSLLTTLYPLIKMVLGSTLNFKCLGCPYTPARINPKHLNCNLSRALIWEGELTMNASLDLVEYAAAI
jgi:hypothetical protein